MTLTAGSRLGPYEVTTAIGAGGMGEVWRAKDTRLDREVAIKILPAGLAKNAEFLQRFDREARAISQLNHPHVCTLYDVGQEAGVHYLVMEILEGESLAERVRKGPLPLTDVLKFGRQVASALDAAHRRGITHRDLKPGNIMLTKAGAKLLDFGLARTATEGKAPVDGLTSLPTEAKPLTTEGTILGTFQYMAPEQLEGLSADARTDIFALGAVIYEMATGRRAFQGQSKTSLIAAIVSSQPEPISSVVSMTPPALDHVVRKCLEKDPDDRWQSAHDVAGQLQWISEAGSQAGVAPAVTVRRRAKERLGWVALVALAATVAALAAWRIAPGSSTPPPPMMFAVQAPEGTFLRAISPSRDGRKLLLMAVDPRGESRLWVRSVATGAQKELAGTTNTSFPFWSPDGEWIAFFVRSKLFKVPADGSSSPIEIAEASSWRGDGIWGAKGTILFSPSWDSPLYGVSDKGGQPEPVTTLEPGEASHSFGYLLDDGRILVGVRMKQDGGRKDVEGVYVQSPGEAVKKLVLRVNPDAWGLTSRGILQATQDRPGLALRSFDQRTLQLGEPEEYDLPARMQYFDVSQDLGLATQIDQGPDSLSTATWYDRSGKATGTIGEPGFIESPAISPDGTQVALEYATAGVQEIRNYEVRRGIAISVHKSPITWKQIWSPDGRSIVFARQTEPGKSDIVRTNADGSGDLKTLMKGDHYLTPESISRDGRWLLFTSDAEHDPSWDIWIEDLENPGKPRMLIDAPNGSVNASFSPDGHWVAFAMEESGRPEVYVVEVQSGRKARISSNGGFFPLWRGDQRELFYVTPADEVMAVSVESRGDELVAGQPALLFKAPILGSNRLYDVTKDGRRFLILTGEQYRPPSARVLVNWFRKPTPR